MTDPENKSAKPVGRPRGSSNRAFGLVFTVFFLIVAFMPLVRGGEVRWWALILAVIFLWRRWFFARALAWPNRAWLMFGEMLHRLTSPLALGLIYLVGIVLVNTSFNVRGEPIVCSPEGAYRCFMDCGIQVLVVGNCVLAKTEQLRSGRTTGNRTFEPD